MTVLAFSRHSDPPALARLSRLAALGESDKAAVLAALSSRSELPVRRELVSEGREITSTLLVAGGWGARVRLLADGRRQFLSFLLPGDLIGYCRQPRPLAVCTIVALTDLIYCEAPDATSLPNLAEAYAVGQALDEGYLLNQITRLGRMNAQERIGDLLLELHERLLLAGLATPDGFRFPLTQETLSDAVGLTPVHVNRTLKTLRSDGGVDAKQGRIIFRDPAGLAAWIGRTPLRVSAAPDAPPLHR